MTSEYTECRTPGCSNMTGQEYICPRCQKQYLQQQKETATPSPYFVRWVCDECREPILGKHKMIEKDGKTYHEKCVDSQLKVS